MDELDDFQRFIDQDEAGKQGSTSSNPMGLGDAEFEAYVRGEAPDIDGLAAQALADKKVAELEEIKGFIRGDMTSKGWDHEKHEWKKPAPVEEDVTAPMPAAYQDEHGSPLVSPDRWEVFSEHEAAFSPDRMSDESFELVLKARAEGRSYVSRPEPASAEDVEQVFSDHLFGDLVD